MGRILARTFEDFEFGIIGDVSVDATRSTPESYSGPQLRILTNEQNLEFAATLIRGRRDARCRYVARQDSNDISAGDRPAPQTAHLDRHPSMAHVASSYGDAARV